MTPTDPKNPGGNPDADRAAGGRGPRPGGHGSYKIGGEPATGHRWHEAPPPPPPPSGRYVAPTAEEISKYDDGVLHDPHVPGDPLHNEDVDHEHRDINVRAVIGSAIAIVVVGVVAQVLIWLLFGVLERQAAANDPRVSPLASPPAEMPKTTRESPFFNPSVGGAQLMTNEPMGLERQRGAEQKQLQGYGWVNQGAGIAHIPIEEAKKLIEQRGLPTREGEGVTPSLGTRLPARGESSGGRVITVAPAAGSETPAAAPAGHGEQPQPPAHAPAEGQAPAKPHGPGGH